MSARLRSTEERIGDVTVLRLTGRLVLDEGDLEYKRQIDRLVEAGQVKIVVDLAGVDYIDSAGVGMLVAKLKSVRVKGGDVKLLNLTAKSHRLLALTRLTLAFEIVDTVEQAVKSFEMPLPPRSPRPGYRAS